jgi:hypothetical protein
MELQYLLAVAKSQQLFRIAAWIAAAKVAIKCVIRLPSDYLSNEMANVGARVDTRVRKD